MKKCVIVGCDFANLGLAKEERIQSTENSVDEREGTIESKLT